MALTIQALWMRKYSLLSKHQIHKSTLEISYFSEDFERENCMKNEILVHFEGINFKLYFWKTNKIVIENFFK